MTHPFFNVPAYPWSHPTAGELLRVLSEAVTDVKDINIKLYKSCADDLPQLDLNRAPDQVWVQVLENLTRAGKLRGFCYGLLTNPLTRNTPTLAEAVQAVIEATASGPGKTPPPVPPKPPWKLVALALAVGLALGLMIGVGVGSGRMRPHVVANSPPAAELPAAQVVEPNDKAVRAELSDNELSIIEDNVNREKGSTVLIVTVGPWPADVQVNVHVRPAENASDKEDVYGRSRAFLKRGAQTTSYEVRWDSAAGSFAVHDVKGAVGDQLYILVVLPVTKNSEPLLSDSKTMKRFLCVEVSR